MQRIFGLRAIHSLLNRISYFESSFDPLDTARAFESPVEPLEQHLGGPAPYLLVRRRDGRHHRVCQDTQLVVPVPQDPEVGGVLVVGVVARSLQRQGSALRALIYPPAVA